MGTDEAVVLGKGALTHLLNNAGERLDLLMATRVVWGAIVVLWISRRFDASLIVLATSFVTGVATYPAMERAIDVLGPYLPGVASRVDWSAAAGWFVGLMNAETANAICGSLIVLLSVVVGWFVSKKSPVAGLILYITTFILNAQSGFFDGYPIRLLVPLVLVGLSVYSRHIRYLNLSSTVFAVLFISATMNEEPPEVKDLAPRSLWFGFALLVFHDVLVRAGVVEWLSVAGESVVLIFTLLNVFQTIASEMYGIKFTFFEVDPLTWPQILSADCLPECIQRFEVSLPGLFCTFFCVVTILRNVVGGKCSVLKTLLSTILVVALVTGILFGLEKEERILEPNISAVVAALALKISELFSSVSKKPEALAIDYHILIYWHSKSKEKHSDMGPSSPRGSEEIKGIAQAIATPVPSENQVEDVLRLIEHDCSALSKLKKTHKKYKDALFRQKALVGGLPPGVEQHKKEQEKVEVIEQKLRQISSSMETLEKQIAANQEKAKAFEQRLGGHLKKE